MKILFLITLVVFANSKSHNRAFQAETVGCSNATTLIKKHEGYRPCEYKDSLKIPTICYGFNLDRNDARSKIESVGGNYENVLKGGCLSRGQCDTLLAEDIKVAEKDEVVIFGPVCGCVRYVLVDMTYNVGYPTMQSFHTFIGLIKEKNWELAAEDLKTTKWCEQVGIRCGDDVAQIKNGCFENEIIADVKT